jgi:hypothetical protein
VNKQFVRTTILVATPDQVAANLTMGTSESVIILGMKDGIYYELSDVGARMWALLQQPCSFESIVTRISEEYDVDAETCKKDLMALANELINYGLIVVCSEPPLGQR